MSYKDSLNCEQNAYSFAIPEPMRVIYIKIKMSKKYITQRTFILIKITKMYLKYD